MMQLNSEVFIPDTSCLILLYKIGSFDVLEGFGKQILVTPEVADEFGSPLPSSAILKSTINKVGSLPFYVGRQV